MKALILYRSHYGNTKQVAEILAKELGKQGIESAVLDIRQKPGKFEEYDVVLIGAPTRMGRVTHRALSVLKRLAKKGWGRKPVAVFDTMAIVPTNPEELEKSRKWLFPGAAGRMQERAKALGLNVYEKTLRAEVKDSKGPLTDGQAEKAAAFATEFALFLKK